MFASVNYSPVYAGEGEATVAVSGPMCGGCIGKLTRNAKKVEGISKLVVAKKDFGAKKATITVTFAKGADQEKALEALAKKTGFKFALAKN